MVELFWRIVAYFDVLASFSIVRFVAYVSTLSLLEGFCFVFLFYFIFVYPSMRLVYRIFFGKWYKKYAHYDGYVYTNYGAFASYIGMLRLLKSLRVGEKLYRKLKPMPLWMDIIAFQVILSELGFVIFGSINYFMYY